MHVARNSNPETHNTPTASEVAAIVIDQNTAQLRALGGGFTRIFETHESYDPLQYSLLFPYSERGWSFDLPYVGNPVDSHGNALAMSLREYESILLHGRTDSAYLFLKRGYLMQQYCVDQWAKCEHERLRFIERKTAPVPS
ncbi:hypothetical protein PC116_g23940 [Phytophthora cactorum]|uniref:Uncharacterized protein n=1 Tax=Phytophthora cactorum TaxID=29920 RepID=A0A8T1BEL4_9STRA|nr:hypothetical protein PC114_g21735 [Phytophthora cactorum]KAG2902077.1 hypothetical protein PC117_g21570 [Phytophthora cactorum]KAG2979757.1 hypothetical protein PC119_g21398 [Phytophthora cactorum]KAG3133807.1 hypothetical protein C6341_g22388 [Phytophthora cactorum]KAG4227685.1 hypothetical protein PC116_g23940 [Phytophthora cactorum]